VTVPALKEWAVVVQALLAGEQILDVRKGGIREDGRHFALRADRCWLYPTTEHERVELLKPAYRRWLGPLPDAPQTTIGIAGWADIVGVARITEPSELDAIESKLIWTRDYMTSRLEWKSRDALWVLALRAHRLLEPITIPFDESYAGCASWVEIEDLVDDPARLASEPALSAESFSARLKLCADALPGGFAAPEPTPG
jgi:hypothetical protein